MAWKINFWARLQDGDHAYKLLGDLLRPCVDEHTKEVKGGGSYPNLFCAHPPFQIDGNFGGTAGIAEMLIQSQSGLIEFLPALPSAWKNGSFSGLKVRNGGEVSAKWTEGLLTEARLKAIVPGSFLIKSSGEFREHEPQKEPKAGFPTCSRWKSNSGLVTRGRVCVAILSYHSEGMRRSMLRLYNK